MGEVANLLGRLRIGLAGRYTIERELGAGGMATVYLAHDVKHRRMVAIKVLRPELASLLGPDRFLREVEPCLQPEGLVSVHDASYAAEIHGSREGDEPGASGRSDDCMTRYQGIGVVAGRPSSTCLTLDGRVK